MGAKYWVPDTTVYEQAGDELVVIELDRGAVYYFNASARAFLDAFRKPMSLAEYVSAAALPDEEIDYLRGLCDCLLQIKVLRESTEADEAAPPVKLGYTRPVFLRKEKTVVDGLRALGEKGSGALSPPPPPARGGWND